MKNDNSDHDRWGHVPDSPSNPFWSCGDLLIRRHCDGVFTLEKCGVDVMPPAPFEVVVNYMRLEFDYQE